MPVSRYKVEDQPIWNAFVQQSRNATFLFDRGFMDYHKYRFQDCSLVFTNAKGQVTGLLPANICENEHRVESHGGLTYGGLLLSGNTSLENVADMLKEASSFYSSLGVVKMLYKPTPYIYHTYPSQEDLYWLFRSQALLKARTVSTTIDLTHPLPFSTLRRRKVQKAKKAQLTLQCHDTQSWKAYWQILTDVLSQQHQTLPVHTYDEILLLAARFPQQIQLHTVYCESTCIAGCVTFDCGPVVHVQYIAGSPQGKEKGALDLLFQHLISHYQKMGKSYFDFGISTEDGGNVLNEGLLFQKEGFGGRAVCYDTYEIDFNKIGQL